MANVALTPAAVKARTDTAIARLRKENWSGGVAWFPIVARAKVTTQYRTLGASPFCWYQLISAEEEEFLTAYGARKFRDGLLQNHKDDFEIREWYGAAYIAVKDRDVNGLSKAVSCAPDGSNVARGGDDMDILAAQVRSSLRGTAGSADMMPIPMETDETGTTNGNGEDGRKRSAGEGGYDEDEDSKKQRCSDKVNEELNKVAASLLFMLKEEGKYSLPSEELQGLAQEIMTRCSSVDGTISLMSLDGKSISYEIFEPAEEIKWQAGAKLSVRSVDRRREKLRSLLHSVCDGNLSLAGQVLSGFSSNLKRSDEVRNDKDLVDAMENVDQTSATETEDKNIVDSVKRVLNLKIHKPRQSGSRGNQLQHGLDFVVASVSGAALSASKIASRLGISPKAASKGKEDHDDIMIATEESPHKFCGGKVRKERGDAYRSIAAKYINLYAHDAAVTMEDNHAGNPARVELADGTVETHTRRTWCVKGPTNEQYQRFISNDENYYHQFQKEVIAKKGIYYGEGDGKKMPTINYNMFQEELCPCVGAPSAASCVDITRDSTQLALEAMEAYVHENKATLQERLACCICAECLLIRLGSPKTTWLDLFTRRDGNSVNYAMKKCLCPRESFEELTLDDDESDFKMYPWKCAHLECQNCGPQRKLPWNCPVFTDCVDEIECHTWKKEASGAGDQMTLVKDSYSVKEVMTMLKAKLLECIPHESDKTWLNRTRKIDINTFNLFTMLVCTDFAALLDLEPNRTKCAHVNRHAVLQIFYIFTNPRYIVLPTGETKRIVDCDVWHIFGDTADKNTKHDHVFHNASLRYIIQFYIDKGIDIQYVRVWTDNCTAQYKCRYNFYNLSHIPLTFPSIKQAEHCFAQVYSFKGPWDAAGRMVKWYIRKLEQTEKERVNDAFSCYIHATEYFKNNLPGGKDWNAMEEEMAPGIEDRTVFSSVNRYAGFATDDTDLYQKYINEGHEHIINTHRSEAVDTEKYHGSHDKHHFKGTGVETAEGAELFMSSKPCRCKHCLTIPDNCRFGNIRGTPEAFYRQPLQYYIDHRQQMQQQNQNAMIELVEAILPRLLPYGAHSDRDLKALVKLMGKDRVPVVRQDGRTGNDGKPLAPLKMDRVAALEAANVTVGEVQARIDELRAVPPPDDGDNNANNDGDHNANNEE